MNEIYLQKGFFRDFLLLIPTVTLLSWFVVYIRYNPVRNLVRFVAVSTYLFWRMGKK